MLAKKDALEILKRYNINSGKYEPTIYENNNQIGICLDIKDSLFGFLTRIFTFNEKEELNSFLASFFWYKNNHQKYNIKLTLDKYDTKNPQIIYLFNNEKLTLENMLNMENYLETKEENKAKDHEKEYYLKCVEELTNYLINFKQMKENIKLEKNKLKTEENDLKYSLLTELTIYYGKEKPLTKKEITLESPSIIDNSLLLENLKNIKTKSLQEVKDYLNALINNIKVEELDEKNLVNIYSNSVYKYNIDILKKQIDFVKSKIYTEKNFNVKGSKIHNIDAELKSFLKTNVAPTKIEIFLIDNQNKIMEKFQKITDLKNACEIITGHKINIEPLEEEKIQEEIDIDKVLNNKFKELDKSTQSNLILYHSLYKPLCNYIINNNYPDKDTIISNFDFNHYYQELEEIVYHENNNHYLINYFSHLNFKDLNSYLDSIIKICQDVENTKFHLPDNINLFSIPDNNKYKQLTKLPSKNTKYLITTNHDLLFIPTKLEIDWNTLEISIEEDQAYYTNEFIIEDLESITLVKYNKTNIEKDGIIITTDLTEDYTTTFNKSHLEGGN